jgi:hypothetical protein
LSRDCAWAFLKKGINFNIPAFAQKYVYSCFLLEKRTSQEQEKGRSLEQCG